MSRHRGTDDGDVVSVADRLDGKMTMTWSRRPPLFLRLLNPIATFLAGRIGLAPGGVMVLRVRRRSSGGDERVPLNVLVHQGAYHLVSLFGETDWLLNLRAAGRASLVRGRTTVPVEVAEELTDGPRVAALRVYLNRWDGQLGMMAGLDRTSSDDALREAAERVRIVRLKLSS
jgi:hypothetical protein